MQLFSYIINLISTNKHIKCFSAFIIRTLIFLFNKFNQQCMNSKALRLSKNNNELILIQNIIE